MEMPLDFKRYEIYIADLNPTVGSEIRKKRPVVIVSQNEMNIHLETVVVCPLTTKIHVLWRSRLQVKCKNKFAEIAIDQIRTISKRRLLRKIGKITEEEAAQVRRIITEMYGE